MLKECCENSINYFRSRIYSSTLDKRLSTVYEPEQPIQDLTNIDSLDLFDPLYFDDVEIQNEDNLSLTIHRLALIVYFSLIDMC